GIDLKIDDGEFIVLVGPSGCGKSTLLRMIAGLEEISAGTVRIGGRVVNELPPRDRDIAMVFQSYALYPHMNVADNMSYSLRLKRAPKERIAEAVRIAAGTLGLEALLERRPRALSGGQRQRVAMGRAIVRKPKAFLFDEPLSNLDARLREQMRTEIKKLHFEIGATSVYVTHDQIEAMTMADRIVAMHHGVVQQVGSPLEIYDRPANVFVASFIGSPAMNFVRGTYRADGEAGALGIGELQIGLPAALTVADGAPILAGIRPEHLRISADAGAGLRARIELIEPMGVTTLIHVSVAGEPVKVLSFERQQLAPGMQVGVAVAADRMHLFDPETEQRLN
ncbi:MAG TPA: sn-glycerol-3-phosphate ABC transporter ATP-binding protein UgpC, partial [Propylenella sp.]|nr:sn-glycerol-3-phosphate ABC transporter ATP-binding protein UgpC [Propylenella sp.]